MNNAIVGLSALVVVLIIAGIMLYMRDPKPDPKDVMNLKSTGAATLAEITVSNKLYFPDVLDAMQRLVQKDTTATAVQWTNNFDGSSIIWLKQWSPSSKVSDNPGTYLYVPAWRRT